jgi:inner membrane protein
MDTNITQWVRYSVSFRIAVVGALAVLLLIPVALVKDIMNERESTKREAIAEISQKWGERQTVAGPILSVPYKKYVVSEKGERVSITEYAHFLPETLFIDGTLTPQIRSRGIFSTAVYSSELRFSGNFTGANLRELGIALDDADWSKSFISVGVSDTRGIEDNVKLTWNSAEIPFSPGVPTGDVIRGSVRNGGKTAQNFEDRSAVKVQTVPFTSSIGVNAQSSGISALLPENMKTENGREHEFSFTLKLNGSQDIQFIPAGRTTEIALRSDWNAPSFGGAFLPDTREVSDKGFTASWKILDINRGYPQSWLGNTYDIYSSASGVELLAGIDGYAKATRSAKYALLIIALTFLVFFFAEVFNRKKVHPIQYVLVGLALVLFYALLVSASEIIGFGPAYAASSVATIGLITFYSKSVLNGRMAKVQGLILAFLYLFIYILLQLEDYALFIGSVFLFAILATVMYISRKVDWYGVGG